MSQDFTLKVLFLSTAASAQRFSEIHALCIDPSFLIQNPYTWYFRLALNPAFLPKMSTEVALSSDLEITAFFIAQQSYYHYTGICLIIKHVLSKTV